MNNRTVTHRSALLKTTAEEEGACLVGLADISCLDLPVTEEYPFAICFALRYSDEIVECLPDDTLWDETSITLTSQAHDIYRTIQGLLDDWGYRYTRVPSTTQIDKLPEPGEELPQKSIATLSGLGWIGNSSLLVTPEYGPRVRLGVLLTDMPLIPDTPITESRCGGCTDCFDICPVKGIQGNRWSQGIAREKLVSVPRCFEHLWRDEKTLGRRHLCGLCLKACPIGQGRK